MNKVRWALFGAVILVSASIKAQEVPLTLQEALDASFRNNKEIILSGIDEEIARAKYRQTDAVFLPQVRLSYTGVSTNNPLNAFGFKLQQQSITSNDFNPEVLNYPSSKQNFMTKAEWQQPLINADQVYARQAAQKQVEVYGFKTKRAKEYLTLEITNTYAQLYLAWQAMHVWEEATHAAATIYTDTNNRFEKGYLQKPDVLQVQVEQAMVATKLAEARSTIRNISDQLSLLMGAPGSAIYKADALIQVHTVFDSTLLIPENRSDFQAMRAAIAAHEKMIRSGKTSYIPRLNAFGEYLINDRQPFGFGSDSYLVGAQLSWTLFNGMSTRYKIAEQHAERNKATEQLSYQQEQAQLALRKALRQLDDTRYTLQQQETAVQQTAESLRILQNRYQQGLVTTGELLQALTLLSQQKLNQVLAVFQYNTTVAYLQFLTSSEK
ncbi:TolC family protein [Ohtaekwangia koreensis]|uniref:Outer membrane protein TolC n=1 Tax=Ohtaekwangia koreensis TaxID=688867 RepID=A0A1T5MP75_9BACT|nr:TolC family protein [Ohtaekwangia koreensis]SKC89803.1 Outer membrane protein TolC [Ohtaekwangia koreensis]